MITLSEVSLWTIVSFEVFKINVSTTLKLVMFVRRSTKWVFNLETLRRAFPCERNAYISLRKCVHYNHPLQLVSCNSWWENANIYHFGCQLDIIGCQLSKSATKNLWLTIKTICVFIFSPWPTMDKFQQMVTMDKISSSEFGITHNALPKDDLLTHPVTHISCFLKYNLKSCASSNPTFWSPISIEPSPTKIGC